MKKIFLFCILIFSILITNCKTKAELLKEQEQEKLKYNKYPGEYKEFKYTNLALGLILVFDSDWNIYSNYSEFDDFGKKFSKYFSTNSSEVLFIGYNKEKKIGIKCTCDMLGLDNKKYYSLIKSENFSDIQDYKIKFAKDEEEVTLKNINAIRVAYVVSINVNNIFNFVTVVFSKNDYSYKIDLWIKDSLYSNNKDYIEKIINTIDFTEKPKIITTDTTTDVKKTSIKN